MDEDIVMVDDLRKIPVHDRLHILIEIAESLKEDAEFFKQNIIDKNGTFEQRRTSIEFEKDTDKILEESKIFYHKWHEWFCI